MYCYVSSLIFIVTLLFIHYLSCFLFIVVGDCWLLLFDYLIAISTRTLSDIGIALYQAYCANGEQKHAKGTTEKLCIFSFLHLSGD